MKDRKTTDQGLGGVAGQGVTRRVEPSLPEDMSRLSRNFALPFFVENVADRQQMSLIDNR